MLIRNFVFYSPNVVAAGASEKAPALTYVGKAEGCFESMLRGFSGPAATAHGACCLYHRVSQRPSFEHLAIFYRFNIVELSLHVPCPQHISQTHQEN